MDNKLTYLQLQLVEYGLQCLHEFSYLKTKEKLKIPEIIIQSNDDTFKASTLLKDDNDFLNFRVFSTSTFEGYEDHKLHMNSNHPFREIRAKIHETFVKPQFSTAYLHAFNDPKVFIEQIIELAKSINIQYEFDMPKVWYHYQSLKYPTLSLDFKIADDVEYHLVSIC